VPTSIIDRVSDRGGLSVPVDSPPPTTTRIPAIDAPHLDRRARQRIARRFDTFNQRVYIGFKLAADPVYAAAAHARGNSALPLFDIGCGIGLLAHYLDGCGLLDRYIGTDHDARKIEVGKAALARGGIDRRVQLHHGDTVDAYDQQGDVAMLDVLHYLPRERQPDLLSAAASLVAPGGVLILRNVVREPNWRFRLTVWEEHLLRASGWIPGGAQHYPGAEEIHAPLRDAGLSVSMQPLRGRTPFNSYLMVGRRA
jgi:2-polyprenyl-3-methyl-5-hydroxy-6-metoxy-1,4-benzoquinol methylase